MTNRIKILFFLLAQLFLSSLFSQDPVFSHFYANRMQLNPSLTGIEGSGRYYVGYRNQWPATGAAFVTYNASYDNYVEKLQGGLGIKVMNDRKGDGLFNAYNLDFIYSYQFRASYRLSFSAAMQAGIGQRSFNPGALLFGDMINPVDGSSTGSTGESITQFGYNIVYPDFSTGFSAFYDNLYGGVAVHHLLSPLITDENEKNNLENRLSRRYTAHFGALIPIIENRRGGELMKLSPNLVFIHQQSVHQINYGMDMIYEGFILGLWTRHDVLFNYGNLMFTAGYVSDGFRFRYSYDSKLSNPSSRLRNMGAHEISLIFLYENKNVRNTRRTIKCPKI